MRFNIYDAPQSALGFVVNQASFIEPQVYRIKYPDIQYPNLVPVDTSAPDWVKSITFFSADMVGKADWLHHRAHDIPLADINREKFEQSVEMAAIGYDWTLEEVGHAQMVGVNLTADKAIAARRAYDLFVDDKALNGDTGKGWEGLLNNSNVTIATVDADGTGNSTYWTTKTADQMLRDVNDLLLGVYQHSLTVEIADTLLLPVQAFSRLSTTRLPDTQITALQFLRTHNVYTDQTGQPLTIRAVRGLDTAGAGSTGRMVAYRKDPQVVKMHIPMPHRFLQAQWFGGITYVVPGIFRLGGVEIRRPGAFRYADGIMPTPHDSD